MANDEVVPAHFGAMSDDQFWNRLRLQFDSLSSLFDMRLETRSEAVGSPSPESAKKVWKDDAPRWDGRRAWLLLPYVDGFDQKRLQEQIEIGRGLVASIHERLAKRELSPSLLHDWGRFRAAAGLLEFVYFSKTSVGHGRSALAGGRSRTDASEQRQRWFAHYFLRVYKRGRRPAAEKAVAKLINAITDSEVPLPSGYEVAWFEEFLILDNVKSGQQAELRPAYDMHSLSVRRMKQLIEAGEVDIPPIDLKFPDP